MRSHRDEPLPPELLAYVAARTSFYFASASADGAPYVQHRGGRAGFLVVLDPRTLAFADYAGNRKYDSLGNLRANPRAALILVDYPTRRRLKLWCDVEIVEEEGLSGLSAVLDASPGERIERVFVLRLRDWELNCPKHILPRYSEAEWRDRQPALRLVALDIADPDGYAAYRRQMAPLLDRYGGSFVLDVEGSASVHPATFEPDRVLLIRFPSREAADAFFADPDYVDVRAHHFEPSVRRSEATWLA